MSEYPRISDDPDVQSHYEYCRNQGTCHSLALVFATQQFPGFTSDSIFWEGRWEDVQKSDTLQAYARMAERKGVSTKGKRYISQLAKRPGDERAWVSDRSDIMRIANEDNLGLTGIVNRSRVTGIDDPGPEKPYEVADDIVEDHADDMIAKDPSLAKDRKEIKKHLKRKLSGALK